MAPERSRRTGGGAGSRAAGRPHWRTTIDSWGGFTVIGVILAAVVVLAVIVWVSLPESTSTGPLLGEAIAVGPGTHIDSLDQMEIVAGRPPVGGPHFPRWQPVGTYGERVSDGLAVHALEHGVIWLSFNPSLVTDADLETLRSVASEFGGDVILSPRPENAMAVAAASWGRLLSLDHADRDALRSFVETNRNRSPEPGVR